MEFPEIILNGAETALIDKDFKSIPDFKPKLIINEGEIRIVDYIRGELTGCDEFIMSSAFITERGIKYFDMDFFELDSNVKGKILTTDYLFFTQPNALKILKKFPNIEIRLYKTDDEGNQGFHTKGYLFRKSNVWNGIIGSANLTESALTMNNEWNIKFTSLSDGELVTNFKKEFYRLWENAVEITDSVLKEYEILFKSKKTSEVFKELTSKNKNVKFKRNEMQVDFISNLMEIYHDEDPNSDRALLISATGTGKTYAAAFAIEEFKKYDSNTPRVLFLVHRAKIAEQAKDTFENVLGGMHSYGLFNMDNNDVNADFVFANIQSMVNNNYYCKNFKRDDFDYIIVDEVHRAGSISYEEIFNYFTPKFWLGMTASPERTDDKDIFELFNNNIAHEIRLQDALEKDLLCPFYYYGISDFCIDGEYIDDKSKFDQLTSDARIDHLIENSQKYGYSGDRIKALVFCSSIKEAKKLSDGFNKKNLPSRYLDGNSSSKKRDEYIKRLTDDSILDEDKLKYIFTVDIFNEGVDIPEINQILLARPTQSSIIFIQQLGRGLRKFKGKDYVVILDFIGNYTNNFLIVSALYGDNSFDKDSLKGHLRKNFIKGSSSIKFDKLSKEKIYNSINKATFSDKRKFNKRYDYLKRKLGRIPMLTDYLENNEFDPILILKHKDIACYYDYLKYRNEKNIGLITNEEMASLKFLSKKLSAGKRPHELIILKFLRDNGYFNISDIQQYLYENYGFEDSFESIKGAINVLSLNFYKKADEESYQDKTVFSFVGNIKNFDYENIFFNFDRDVFNDLENNMDYKFLISDYFKRCLSSNLTYLEHFNDFLDYSLLNYELKFFEKGNDGLILYAKYSREDFCGIMNWNTFHSQIHGYVIKNNMCPIFVTYNKRKNISDSIKYKDEFINNYIFSWMTKNNRTLNSKDVNQIKNFKKDNLKLFLFVKNNDSEGKEFYYLGNVSPILNGKNKPEQTEILKDGEQLPIVNFKLVLENPLDENLYYEFIDIKNDED